MKHKPKWVAVAVSALLLVAVLFLVTRILPSIPKGEIFGLFKSKTTAPAVVIKTGKPVIPIPVQMDDICAQLKASKAPASTRQLLDRLRDLLNSLPHDVASR